MKNIEITFKELENIINEEGVVLKGYNGDEVESGSIDTIVSAVRRKIENILSECGLKQMSIMSYRSSLYLDTEYNWVYGQEPSGVKISVKKEVDREHSSWSYTKYKFKGVKIEVADKYYVYRNNGKSEEYNIKSIVDYIAYKSECKKANEEYKNNKKENFKNMLEDKGLSLEDFVKLAQAYKSLDYSTKTDLAREIDKEAAYKYIVQ